MDEILEEIDSRWDNGKEINKLCLKCKSLGIEGILNLGVQAIQKQSRNQTLYVIFKALASLLHPQETPERLNSVLLTCLQLIQQAIVPYVKFSIARCIAASCLHLVTPESMENLQIIVNNMDPESLSMFLSELTQYIEMTLEVPKFFQINYLIIAKFLPQFIEHNLMFFIADPSYINFLNFVVANYDSNQIEEMKKRSEYNDDINAEELSESVQSIFITNLPLIAESYINLQVPTKKNLVNLMINLLKFLNDHNAMINAVDSLMSCEIQLENAQIVLELLKKIIISYQDFQPSDSFYDYISKLAIHYAEKDNIEDLFQTINCLSQIMIRIDQSDNPYNVNPRINTIIQQVLITQLSVSTDDDEINPDIFSDLAEAVVFLTRGDPVTSLQIVINSFNSEMNESQFHWALMHLNEFYKVYKETELDYENFLTMVFNAIQSVVLSPLAGQMCVSSKCVIEEMTKSFLMVKLPDEAAVTIFGIIFQSWSHEDDLIKQAIEISKKYLIPIEMLPTDSSISHRMLEKLVSCVPSEGVESKIIELSNGNDQDMSTIAALIRGLLEYGIDFPIEEYAKEMIRRHMYVDAIKICFKNPTYCVEILAEIYKIVGITPDDKENILKTVTKLAIDVIEPILTDTIMLSIDLNSLSAKLLTLLARLFYKHQEKKSELSDNTLISLVQLSQHLVDEGSGTGAFNETIFDNFITAIKYYYPLIFSLLSNEFWIYYIQYILENCSKTNLISLLYTFSINEPEKYAHIMKNVLEPVCGPCYIDLMESLSAYPSLIDYEQEFFFQEKFVPIAKTYMYYLNFV